MPDETPGWSAIDRVLDRCYPHQEPQHYGTLIKYCLGGPDPLDGISVYCSEKERPHWHYVTYGFSELYAKQSDDPDTSGWGIELTFRLARPVKAKKAPLWPMSLLQNLARYVFTTGNVFGVNHHTDLNGPIALEERTEICAAIFAKDPELKAIKTPHGRVQFVQVYGITRDELEAAAEWNSAGFLKLARRENRLLVTDLKRKSVVADPTFARKIERGIAKDGSSLTGVYVESVSWRVLQRAAKSKLRIVLGANAVRRLSRLLRARLPHDRDFWLWSPKRQVCFEPARKFRWNLRDVKGVGLTVGLPVSLVTAIGNTLEPRRGMYSWAENDDFEIEVKQSQITDRDGKVIDTIG